MATNYNPRIITNGLVLALDAGNTKSYPGSGTTWTNISGQGTNGTLTNGPTFSSINGGSIVFDGTDDSISVLNDAVYDFSAAQTIEIWLKPTENDAVRRNPYNQAYGGYGTWTHEVDGRMTYYYGDAGGDNLPYVGRSSGFTVVENEIACLCTTRDTTESRWYKNGIFDTQYTHSYGTLATTSANITIGSGYAGAYKGSIYVVKLYTRALSANEIAQNFNALRGRFGV